MTTQVLTTRDTVAEALFSIAHDCGITYDEMTGKGEAAIKSAGGEAAALSAYLKTGKRGFADVGAVVDMVKGVGEALAHGQRSRLQGFARACKKQTPGFALARALNIVSDAGAVLVGLDRAVSGDKDCLQAYTPAIVGGFIALQAQAREAAKAAREAASEAAKAEASEAPAQGEASEAAQGEALTPGQQDSAAVAWLVSRVSALSAENLQALVGIISTEAAREKLAQAEALALQDEPAQAEAPAQAEVKPAKKPRQRKPSQAEALAA